MIRLTRNRLVSLTILFLPALMLFGQENLVYSVEAEILVNDADTAGERLESWSKEVGGFVLYLSNKRFVARVPIQRIEAIRPALEDRSERIVSYSRESRNVREEVATLEAGLSARKEILDRNLELLDQADVEGTLAIEKEINKLMTEIENMTGRLRKLRTELSFPLVTVELGFRSQSIPENLPSSFDWINTMDFYRFVGEEL